jgi:hypothetical protein
MQRSALWWPVPMLAGIAFGDVLYSTSFRLRSCTYLCKICEQLAAPRVAAPGVQLLYATARNSDPIGRRLPKPSLPRTVDVLRPRAPPCVPHSTCKHRGVLVSFTTADLCPLAHTPSHACPLSVCLFVCTSHSSGAASSGCWCGTSLGAVIQRAVADHQSPFIPRESMCFHCTFSDVHTP